jgi:FkbM family methyltransferase
MTSIREVLELAACRLGIYRPARNAFHRVGRPGYYSLRRRHRDFFSQFVAPDSLVFDVGANHGRLSEVFIELGARVVAIEPNPYLATAIQRRYGRNVVLEPVAIGERSGQSTLHIGVHDAHSSMSEDWIERVDRPLWTESVTVPVVTLDSLVARHGTPQFIKLDVEGFELQALRGLSVPVEVLSFEYHALAIDSALACLARAADLGFRRFNTAPGDALELTGGWLSFEELRDRLSDAGSKDHRVYGDIYAMT